MSQRARTDRKKDVVALALTWDGARWPVSSLPPKARAFLTGKATKMYTPTAKVLARLFAEDQVRELRICWVSQLKGGKKTLSGPFPVPAGKRVAFQAVKTTRFDGLLGVIYRK